VNRPILASQDAHSVKDFVLARVATGKAAALRIPPDATRGSISIPSSCRSFTGVNVHMAGKKGSPAVYIRHVQLRQDLDRGDDLLGVRRPLSPKRCMLHSGPGCHQYRATATATDLPAAEATAAAPARTRAAQH